jgi:hypothetical protein
VPLAPTLAVLERERPGQRFVAMLCLYAPDVEEDWSPACTPRPAAERCARRSLMPGRDFAGALDRADGRLAEAFNVPLEQIAPRRAQLGARPGAARAGLNPSLRDGSCARGPARLGVEAEPLDEPLRLTGSLGVVGVRTRDLLGDSRRDEAEQRRAFR